MNTSELQNLAVLLPVKLDVFKVGLNTGETFYGRLGVNFDLGASGKG